MYYLKLQIKFSELNQIYNYFSYVLNMTKSDKVTRQTASDGSLS